jgi:hypothetical protein
MPGRSLGGPSKTIERLTRTTRWTKRSTAAELVRNVHDGHPEIGVQAIEERGE